MQPSRHTGIRNAAAAAAASALPGRACAHASEQGLVLLLPTDIYTGAGVAAVAATVILVAFVPGAHVARLFRPLRLFALRTREWRRAASCLSCLCLLLLVWAGVAGPRDPLANPLPLVVWTGFWIGLVTVQGLAGNLWAWLNPWTGPLWLLRRLTGLYRRRLRAPRWMGIATFLAFAGYLLADPAPSDPDRLALAVGLYWAAHLLAALAAGPGWICRAEGLTLALTALARVGVLARRGGRLRLGAPGWQIVSAPAPGLAAISVLLLATGSFDGLNETFWWLGLQGLNPFEYPGRSGVMAPTLAGLAAANAALLGAFALCLWLGLRLARAPLPLARALALFAPTLLPIALGYHVAHYLPTFLVNGQYMLIALSDPLMSGADLLGLGDFYVSTGFFNSRDSVRVIYLAQAGAVVAGHVLAVLTAHALAARVLPGRRDAALVQLPLALLMIAYTLFGLWLLASPRL